MSANLSVMLVALGLTAVVLGGCSPSPTAPPTAEPTMPSPVPKTPIPSQSVLSGTTKVVVTGRIADACIPPPEGCAYWATIVLPGGATLRAELEVNADYRTLRSGPGLPATLPPGRYGLVFEVAIISDAVSPVPIPGGTPGPAPTQPEIACTSTLEISDAPTATVAVTFDGTSCSVKTSS